MMPRLLPLSRVAGSLALSFTGMAHAAPATQTPTATATQPTTAAPVVPTPPPASEAPPVLPAADPAATQPTTTAPPVAASPTSAEMQKEIGEASEPATRTPPPPRAGLLRATDRRYFFTMFVGGSRAFMGGYGAAYGGGMDFKVEGAIGGHSASRPSLAGAAVIQVSQGFPFSSFTIAPRLQWDKKLLPDYAIYMTTTLTAGYRMSTYGGYGLILGALTGGAYHSGVFAVGWGATTIVAERLLLSFRPVNVELMGPGAGFPVQINYDVIGGLGVVW